MLFRTPTCYDLSLCQDTVAKTKWKSRNNGTTTLYVDESDMILKQYQKQEQRKATTTFSSSVVLPTTTTSISRTPHELRLQDGRYALTYYQIHTIPENEECANAQVYFTTRSSQYNSIFPFHRTIITKKVIASLCSNRKK